MADKHAAERQEDWWVGTAFVAHTQTAEAIEPGERAFDPPTVAARALAAVPNTPSDAGEDATWPQPAIMAAVRSYLCASLRMQAVPRC